MTIMKLSQLPEGLLTRIAITNLQNGSCSEKVYFYMTYYIFTVNEKTFL